MRNRQLIVWEKHINPRNSQNLGVVIVILIALFIPISVYLVGKNQDTRQDAAEVLSPNVTQTPQQIDEGIVYVEEIPDPKVGKIPGELVVEFKQASEAAIANVATTAARIE